MDDSFDFDEWAELYRSDPVAFEERRKKLLTQTIEQAPAELQPKLNQLQWRLDGIHRQHTPMGALLVMQNMMWESFLNMNDQLQVLIHHVEGPPKLTRVK